MGWLLFPFRLAAVVVWVLGGLLAVTAVFPLVRLSWRQWLIRHWSRVLLAFCGVRVSHRGQPKMEGPVLWVANHVSWVDIFVLDSLRAVCFIGKSDIRKWPLLGWLVAGAGTLFLERGKRHAVRSVGHQMAARFARGEAVGLFPEGTTSNGLDLLPFHRGLFEPALRAAADIQPVALVFRHRGRRSDRHAFIGEQNLLQNLWVLLTSTGTAVEMVFCPVMDAQECAQLGRVAVAERAEQQIREIVRADAPPVHD